MSDTPRTNKAAYNGPRYLHEECSALEAENIRFRANIAEALESMQLGDMQTAVRILGRLLTQKDNYE